MAILTPRKELRRIVRQEVELYRKKKRRGIKHVKKVRKKRSKRIKKGMKHLRR